LRRSFEVRSLKFFHGLPQVSAGPADPSGYCERPAPTVASRGRDIEGLVAPDFIGFLRRRDACADDSR
jgi:hypothetical protein